MYPFISGSTHLVIGQSGSGKTQFIYRILKNKDTMFGEHPPKTVLFYYGIWQDAYEQMRREIKGIKFQEGLPTESELLKLTDPSEHTVIILDDVQHLAANSQVVELIFTRLSHHRHCTCFYLQQNAFVQGKHQVTISINAKYIEVFRSPRSLLQLQYLNAQIFPNSKNFLSQAYKDIMKHDAYGYLVIDLTAHCPDELRLRTAIFPGEDTIVYCSD